MADSEPDHDYDEEIVPLLRGIYEACAQNVAFASPEVYDDLCRGFEQWETDIDNAIKPRWLDWAGGAEYQARALLHEALLKARAGDITDYRQLPPPSAFVQLPQAPRLRENDVYSHAGPHFHLSSLSAPLPHLRIGLEHPDLPHYEIQFGRPLNAVVDAFTARVERLGLPQGEKDWLLEGLEDWRRQVEMAGQSQWRRWPWIAKFQAEALLHQALQKPPNQFFLQLPRDPGEGHIYDVGHHHHPAQAAGPHVAWGEGPPPTHFVHTAAGAETMYYAMPVPHDQAGYHPQHPLSSAITHTMANPHLPGYDEKLVPLLQQIRDAFVRPIKDDHMQYGLYRNYGAWERTMEDIAKRHWNSWGPEGQGVLERRLREALGRLNANSRRDVNFLPNPAEFDRDHLAPHNGTESLYQPAPVPSNGPDRSGASIPRALRSLARAHQRLTGRQAGRYSRVAPGFAVGW
ncbi:hypothetical protein JCM10213_007712 [Rhodosporidiobolus nylandii]